MNSTKKLPRGLRNNNPLNIRIGNNWKGEVENPTDNVFEQFTEMKWGVRAGFLLLKRYINRYKVNTIDLIIRRWAPPVENYTDNYIELVCSKTGFDRNYELKYENIAEMTILFQAMCFVENGQDMDFNDIYEGYKLANE